MKKSLLFLFFILLSFSSSVVTAQTEFNVDGVIVPRKIEFKGNTLQLNGFGTRSKMFMEVYVQALYLTMVSQNPDDIMESNTDMAIRIQITSSMVSSGKLTKNLHNGFEKSSGDAIDALRPRIEQFKAMLSDKIVEKDVFNLIYNHLDSSVWVYKNDVLKGIVPGFDFKKALFGIWLSNKPVDDDLKNELLGKTE
ncbi:chalcone isomerase family protein [Flavobacterium humi]|uniref:Chalcone isomerase n=1 Tax=Flavobacterium humi TaxID=2562683 RepID=A0A4Z0LBN5_9FLAO|nr:chalcone isomerase family protein [Flavobacterium humi]TGD59273.1 chalcone isomerase [Flavobacterium humi]